MRKLTLLLSALCLFVGLTLEAQGETVVTRAVKVSSLAQLSDGSKVVIRNVGSNTLRRGFVHESGTNLLIDNAATSLLRLDATYVFTISDWDNGSCYLTAASGKKIAGAYSGSDPMQTVDSPEGKVTIQTEATEDNPDADTWDIQYGQGNYFNNQTAEAYGPYVNTWTVAGDANASWEIYAVQVTGETVALTDFNPENGAAYYIDCQMNGKGRAACFPDATIMGVTGDNADLTLANLFTVTDVTDEIGAATGTFHIRSYADPSYYVYYLNTNDANANVGITTDATHANLAWTISTTQYQVDGVAPDGYFNIIPATGTRGWNCRGTEPVHSNTAIGQWGSNNTADNSWSFEKVTEEQIAEAATAYKTNFLSADWASVITSEEVEKIGYPFYSTVEQYNAAVITSTDDLAALFNNISAVSGIISNPTLKFPASTSGLYRIKNKLADRYLFQETDEKGITFLNDGADNSKYYYRVTVDDQNSATIRNANGQVPARGPMSKSYSQCTAANKIAMSPITLQYAADADYFVLPNCHNSTVTTYTKTGADYDSDTNPCFITTWATTENANRYAFEPYELKEGENIYDIVISGGTENTTVTYTANGFEGQATVYSGGFYVLTSAPASTDFTLSDPEYVIESVDVSDNTVTITLGSNTASQERLEAAREVLAKTGVGYPVADAPARATLQSVIDGTPTYAELAAALAAYKGSTDNIQMPEDGKAYTFTAVNYAGARCYMDFTADSGYGLVGTTDSDNANYPASAILVCHEIGNGKYLFANNYGKYFIWKGTSTTDGNNDNKGYVDSYTSEWCDLTIGKMQTGSYVTGTADALFGYMTITGKRSSSPGGQNYFVIDTTGETYTYNQANAAFFDATHSSAILIEEATYPNVVTLNSADGIDDISGIGTFSAPFPTLIPQGVTAYYVKQADETSAQTEAITAGAIPANTGVLLTGTASDQVTMTPAATETQAEIAEGDNLLQHSAGEAKTIGADENAYVLTRVGEEVAFYLVSSDESKRTIGMNKAYLVVPEGNSFVLRMRFGDTTGLAPVATPDTDADAPVYDLSGRRVVNPAKGGLYIRGGKKFIVK